MQAKVSISVQLSWEKQTSGIVGLYKRKKENGVRVGWVAKKKE